MKAYVQYWWCNRCDHQVQTKASIQTGFLKKCLCPECAKPLQPLKDWEKTVVVDFTA
jgi:hypothetical protein